MTAASVIPRRALAALVLAAACWGVGTVISKGAVAEVPPLTLLVVQLSTSVITLGGAWWVLGRGRSTDPGRAVPAARRDPALDWLGLLNPGFAYALSLVGLTQLSASLSVLLWAGEPILILGLAWWWLRERVTRRLLGWSLAALTGMGLIVWAPGVAGQGFGVAATLAGVGCCAVYSVLTRRRIGEQSSTLRVVLGQQAWALGLAIGLLIAGTVLAGTAAGTATATPLTTGDPPGAAALVGLPGSVSVGGWVSAIASGVMYYTLAYGCYLTGLRHVPASIAATAFYLIPVFGVAAGWAFLGERLEPAQWIGAAVVLGSLAAIASREAPGRNDSVVEMGES